MLKYLAFCCSIIVIINAQKNDNVSPKVAKSVLHLGQNILKQVLLEKSVKVNTMEVISPLSIAGAISLVELGAIGQTYGELVQLMGQNELLSTSSFVKVHKSFGELVNDAIVNYPEVKESDEQKSRKFYNVKNENQTIVHQISVANALFLNKNFEIRPAYKTAAQTIYHSEVENLDFAGQSVEAKNTINNWVNTKTNGKIKKIVEEVRSDTSLIILSALYFKALWHRDDIAVSAARAGTFYPDGQQGQRVLNTSFISMGVQDVPYYVSKEYDCKIIGLPYEDRQSQMYIIIPNQSSRQNLIEFQSNLSADKIQELISKTEKRSGDVFLPKFHIESTVDLVPILNKLGVKSMFTQGISELSLIKSSGDKSTENKPKTGESSLKYLDELRNQTIANPGLYATSAIHKVVIDVDEKGTEGGAVTSIAISPLSLNTADIFVRCDTPFLFLIKHEKSNLPLFYGAVFEPKF